MKKEIRHSHFQLDYPEPGYENWSAWINIYKGHDGKTRLEKQQFGNCHPKKEHLNIYNQPKEIDR